MNTLSARMFVGTGAPHGYCLLWDPVLVFSHVSADLLIALSYFSISAVLALYAYKRPSTRYRPVLWMFGAFITSCGLTHMMHIWVLWHPDYGVEALIKFLTAIVSMATATMLWPLLPKVLRLPSREYIEALNDQLQREVLQRQRAEAEIRRANETLELRVAQRTQELERTNGDLHEEINRRQLADAQLRRLTQMYAALSETNQIIVRTSDDASLFSAICRIVVDQGGMATAWIGELDRAGEQIRPIASYGEGRNDLEDLSLSSRMDDPAWIALRENRLYLCKDALEYPVTAPWQTLWQKFGWAAAAAFPIERDGTPRYVLKVYSKQLHAFDQEVVTLLTEMALDISHALGQFDRETQRRSAVWALRESETRFRHLLHSINDVVWSATLDGRRLLFVNPSVVQVYGRTPEEFYNRRSLWLRVVHPDDRARVKEKSRALLQLRGGETEYRIVRPDGAIRWLHDRSTVVFDETGAPTRLGGIVSDITERKQAEQALRESLRSLEQAEKIAHLGHYEIERRSGSALWSPEVFRIFGLDPAQPAPAGYAHGELVHPDDRTAVSESFEASIGQGHSFDQAYRILRSDGEIRYVHSLAEPVRNETGEITGLFGTLMDITEQRQAEEALRESEERFRHISSSISDIAYACVTSGDGTHRFEWMTGASERITGYSLQEIKALGWWRELVHEDDRDRLDGEISALTPGASGSCELRLRHKKGGIVWAQVFAERAKDPRRSNWTHLYGALIDITERREAEDRLRLHAAVMSSTRDGVVICDLSGNILAINRAFTEITGYSETEITGRNPRLLKSGHHDHAFYESLWACLLETGHWQGEIWNRRKSGEVFPEWLTISTVRDSGLPTHYVGVFTDISQLKQTETRLERLAHYDPLTDLPNRTLLQFRLEHAVQRARRGNQQVGVLFIDLDRFKNINDSLGHSTGDLLLRDVSQRLRKRVRESDTLGRLGGDEFLVVLEQLVTREDSVRIACELLATLEAPFTLPDGREVYIGASVGISLYPEDGRIPEELIRNADAAMYQVKTTGRNAYAHYTRALTLAAKERLDMETRLRRALERQEFVLWYQPLVSVQDGRLLGAEALVRWQPPGEPLMLPARFIPLAEETGLIVPLGVWVLRQACTQAKRWQDSGLVFDQVAINLSVRQFQHPALERIVRTVLAETGLSPDCVELEITESSLMGTSEQAVANLTGIKAMGLRLSIDDFGTGYSSLSYLKRLPLDRLKIDYSFIRDIPNDANDVAIASTIIAMAHTLGLQALAEGVESEAQLDFLRQEGCDAFQGFLYSAPVPADEFARRFLGPAPPTTSPRPWTP